MFFDSKLTLHNLLILVDWKKVNALSIDRANLPALPGGFKRVYDNIKIRTFLSLNWQK